MISPITRKPPLPDQKIASSRSEKKDTVGNYQVHSTLGQGSFAIVYLVSHRKTGKYFAMKSLNKLHLKKGIDVSHLQREINCTANLIHENIVSLRDFFEDEKFFYLVYDYCAGGTLADYITSLALNQEKITEKMAKMFMNQIISAVSYCHRNNVCHRDLKPENILFCKFPQLKICDFGLCGLLSEENPDKLMETFCGSPMFCSPECLMCQKYDGIKHDIWSCGIILYTMVTGHVPWRRGTQHYVFLQITKGKISFPDFISNECKDLIQKMTMKNSEERISIDEIINHPFMNMNTENNSVENDQGRKEEEENLEFCYTPTGPRPTSLMSHALPPLFGLEKSREPSNVNDIESPFEIIQSVRVPRCYDLPTIPLNATSRTAQTAASSINMRKRKSVKNLKLGQRKSCEVKPNELKLASNVVTNINYPKGLLVRRSTMASMNLGANE